jgi:hypothetical protein
MRRPYLIYHGLWAALALLLGALACGAPTGDPVGIQGPDRPIHKAVFYPADLGWEDTYYDVFVPTGRHYRLAVGSWRGFRSRSLLRFELGDIPKEVPISKIKSVTLRLPYLRVSGSLNDDIYADGDVALEVRRLYRDFDEDRATWWRASRKENWSEEGGDFGPVAACAVIGKPTFQREFVDVDVTDMALDWLANPYRNYGLVLKAADEDAGPGFKEFYSTNEYSKVNTVRLVITYKDEGEKTYNVVSPEKDCFITEYDGEFRGDSVHGYDGYLDFGSFNGYGRRALMYFNFSPGVSRIPSTASIARAKLRLYYLPAGKDERVYVAVYRLTGPFGEGARQDELELTKFHDNAAYIDREFKAEPPGYIDLYINPLVQEWISGTHPNYGLMIKAPDESQAQAFPRFGSRDNADPARRPYLEIEYTLPDEPWYASPAPGNS